MPYDSLFNYILKYCHLFMFVCAQMAFQMRILSELKECFLFRVRIMLVTTFPLEKKIPYGLCKIFCQLMIFF